MLEEPSFRQKGNEFSHAKLAHVAQRHWFASGLFLLGHSSQVTG
jgi:hypothetical protein